MPEPRRKMPGETAFGVLLLIFSVFVFWQAYKIAGFSALSSPGSFPMAAAAIMVIASLITLLRNTRLGSPELTGTRLSAAFFRQIIPPIVMMFVVIIIGFAVALESLGFLLAAFVFLLASIGFLRRQGLFSTFIIALGSLILIYVVFRLVFKVVLPEGIVPEREIMAWVETLFAAGGVER